MTQIERYAQLAGELAEIENEMTQIEMALRTEVNSTGEVMYGGGYVAYMKHGRNSTDHEAAAKSANVPASIIQKYSTVKTIVAWAKVTKEAKVNIEPFTVQGDPVFVIEQQSLERNI